MHTFRDLVQRAARRQPQREWVVCRGERPTYAELASRVRRLQAALLDLGFEAGDRIAVLSLNCHRVLELLWSLPAAGYTAVPINFRLTPPEIAYLLRDSGSRALFVGPEHLGAVTQLRDVESLEHVFALQSEGEGLAEEGLAYEELLSGSERGTERISGPAVDEDSPAFIMYTSGTTGFPKGAVLSHRNVIDAAVWGVSRSAFDGIGPKDRVLVPVPLYHVAGTVTALTALVAGATTVLLSKVDMGELLATVASERITRMTVVPFILQHMLEHPEASQADLSSLRSVLYAGAPTPVPVLERALDRWGPIFVQAYGLTETGPSGTTLTIDDHRRALAGERPEILASVGREMLHCDLRVVDAEGCSLPAGEIGEVAIRSSSVMREYWGNPEATAESLRDGWFYTGDMGRFDEEGYLYLVDRKKDMIISGGENVYPKEVETVLFEHAAVTDCAVLGLADERWGERVTAVVVTDEPVSAEDLVAYCRERLAGYKCPKTVHFLDALPRNPSGKVLKKELRESLESRAPGSS